MKYELWLVAKDHRQRIVDKWEIPELTIKKGEVKKVKFLPSGTEIKKSIQEDYKNEMA
jgi:hypothetical protein